MTRSEWAIYIFLVFMTGLDMALAYAYARQSDNWFLFNVAVIWTATVLWRWWRDQPLSVNTNPQETDHEKNTPQP